MRRVAHSLASNRSHRLACPCTPPIQMDAWREKAEDLESAVYMLEDQNANLLVEAQEQTHLKNLEVDRVRAQTGVEMAEVGCPVVVMLRLQSLSLSPSPLSPFFRLQSPSHPPPSR